MIGEAAASGDYSAVETLVRWASVLGELSQRERRIEAPPSASSLSPPTNTDAEPKNTTGARVAKAMGKRRTYPFFARSGDSLVKVAWSKSSKSEYQHKSPRKVALKLAEALARQAKNGAIVAMEKVLPLMLDDGASVPDYQVYVSLAWFRQIGAVKQNGRQGYTIKQPSELGKKIESAWSELAEGEPT